MTATNIEASLWHLIIEHLLSIGWTMTYKYDNFDAGIDDDFIILEKGNEEILFGWDNWFEGEMKGGEDRMKELQQVFRVKFERGEPINLKPSVIELHRAWKEVNK